MITKREEREREVPNGHLAAGARLRLSSAEWGAAAGTACWTLCGRMEMDSDASDLRRNRTEISFGGENFAMRKRFVVRLLSPVKHLHSGRRIMVKWDQRKLSCRGSLCHSSELNPIPAAKYPIPSKPATRRIPRPKLVHFQGGGRGA